MFSQLRSIFSSIKNNEPSLPILKVVLGFVLIAGMSWGISGCVEQNEAVAYFIAPSVVPQSSPVVVMTPTMPILATPTYTPEPACEPNLAYLADVTVPDGTVFAPNEEFVKTWRVDNNGTCNWDEGYRIRLTSGAAMGVDEEQALFPARAGSEAEISITFIAPSEAGVYQSTWKAVDPEGNAFGELFYVEIQVAE